MAVRVVGTVVPLVPGLALVWGAALAYGLLEGFGTTGTAAFTLITALAVAGALAGWVVPTRVAGAAGAARSSILLGQTMVGTPSRPVRRACHLFRRTISRRTARHVHVLPGAGRPAEGPRPLRPTPAGRRDRDPPVTRRSRRPPRARASLTDCWSCCPRAVPGDLEPCPGISRRLDRSDSQNCVSPNTGSGRSVERPAPGPSSRCELVTTGS
jgi:Protein of unknown function (DUF456)